VVKSIYEKKYSLNYKTYLRLRTIITNKGRLKRIEEKNDLFEIQTNDIFYHVFSNVND